MKRLWIIGAAVLLIAWFGLKDFVYRSVLTANTPASAEPLDYSDVDSWAAFPEMRPPGAWETPWGVDVFLIGPPTGIASGQGLVDARGEAHREKFDSSITELSRALPRGVPIYAPHYHSPSAVHPAGDMADIVSTELGAAFEQYLTEQNRDRAVLLAIDERALSYAQDIATSIASQSEDGYEKLAGLVIFGESTGLAAPENCNSSLETACEQTVEMQTTGNPLSFLAPRLPGRINARRVVDPDGTAEAIRVQAEQVSAWLDANGAKPAEPLGSIQEVAIVPIRRPGEVVPDQSDED
ncbi:MAG: hypothetical protein AAF292_10010 [Pseudomonadota bacterium]